MKPNDTLFKYKKDARRVLEVMQQILKEFSVVYVSDLCDLVGLPSTYDNTKWGWTKLENVEIRKVERGYVIDFPPMEKII